MKKYYAERMGLTDGKLDIGLSELNEFFIQTYRFFKDKDYFDIAEKGVWRIMRFGDDEQIIPPSFAPSPEIYFANQLQSAQVWPIWEYYQSYTEEILFTVIEILYDHIAIYDFQNSKINKDGPKEEYVEHINNVLRMYGEGYYFEPQNGFIMMLPNEVLKNQLSYNGEDMTEEIYDKLRTASEMFYRFDSNMELKKNAIKILTDILENVRGELKVLLNEKYQVNKTEHDKLIFGIVNGFNIRHNRDDQKNNYSKEIWYDWMMQYYTSVIITYFRLINNSKVEE